MDQRHREHCGTGELSLEEEQRIMAWKIYLEALFKDERSNIEAETYDSGSYILKDEVEKAC